MKLLLVISAITLLQDLCQVGVEGATFITPGQPRANDINQDFPFSSHALRHPRTIRLAGFQSEASERGSGAFPIIASSPPPIASLDAHPLRRTRQFLHVGATPLRPIRPSTRMTELRLSGDNSADDGSACVDQGMDGAGAESSQSTHQRGGESSSSSQGQVSSGGMAARAKAEAMKREAARARMEAERMDASLTLEKISALETSLVEADRASDTDRVELITTKIEKLQEKIKSSTTTSDGSHPSEGRTGVDAGSVPLPTAKTSSFAAASSTREPLESSDRVGSPTSDEVKSSAGEEDLADLIPKEEFEAFDKFFSNVPKFFRDFVLSDLIEGAEDRNNLTAVLNSIDSLTNGTLREVFEDVNLTPETTQKAISTFDLLETKERDSIASTVGLENGNNSTAVIDKLREEDRIFVKEWIGDDPVFYVDDFGDLFNNPEELLRIEAVRSLFPAMIQAPSEEDVDAFLAEILNDAIFKPSRRPELVPELGYSILGSNRLTDGDELVAAIETNLASSQLREKLQFFYIRAPVGLADLASGELNEVQLADAERPLEVISPSLILVTGPDTVPSDRLAQLFITVLGLTSISSFSADLSTSGFDVGADDLLSGILSPLVVFTIVILVGHEAAHRIAASLGKFKVGFPTIVPSPCLGTLGSATELKTPPKNLNTLFDFSLVGPIVGLGVSLLFLYTGLRATLAMDDASLSLLPSISKDILGLSTLGRGLVDSVVGDIGLFADATNTDIIHLHPLAISGYIGLMVNALALVPIGRNSDGGRIIRAMVGLLAPFMDVISRLIIFGLGVFDFKSSGIVLAYLLFASIFQNDEELPCRNEVDELSFGRVLLAVVAGMLVTLSLFPVE